MAFGAEIRDFVAGFKTGYELIDSKEEKEEKRAERRRKQESHDRAEEHYQNDDAYRKERAAKGDAQWQSQFEFGQERFKYGQKLGGMEQERWSIDRADRLRRENDEMRRTMRGSEGLDDYAPANPYETESDTSDEQSAIPTEGGATQLASYSPDDAADTATATNGFDLNSYLPNIRRAESGGNGNAANPNSSAKGYYQALDGTWHNYANKYPELGLTPDGRGNRAQEEKFIRRFTYDNGLALERAGIPVTNGTMYAAHFLGSGGASRVLNADPSTPVSKLVGRDVLNANPFLKGMTVGEFERWADRKGGGSRRRSKAINAAVGGMVSAIPMDDEEEDPNFTLVASNEEEPSAIPVPTPRPSYDGASEGDEEEPTDDPWEEGRRAVRDGLKHALKQTGADQDSALDDPEMERVRQNYIRGYGAAPAQMMQQVIDKIDPERDMAPAERNMLAMGTVYRFYMDKGETDKAKEAAASMVQYYRQAAQQFLALGQAAAEEGDFDSAAKAAVAAYTNIPNGRDLDIIKNDDGTFTLEVTDGKSGKKIVRKVMSPQEFGAAAMQFNPTTFDDEILNAAGVPADKYTDASLEDVGNVSSGVDETVETDLAESGLTKEGMAAVRDTAVDLAKIKENGLDPARATRLATSMIDAPEGAIKYRPSRGNPGTMEVNIGGNTYVLPKGTLDGMLKLRAANVTAKADAAAAEKKNMKEGFLGTDQMESLRKGAAAFSDMVEENSDRMREGAAQSATGAAIGNLYRNPNGEAIPAPEEGLPEGTNAGRAGASIGAMAIPEQGPQQVPRSDDPDLPEEVRKLLKTREMILEGGDPAKYRGTLQKVEGQLRDMGIL